MTVAPEHLAAPAAVAAHVPAEPAAAAQAVESSPPQDRIRFYVWQLPVRITHWVTAFAIVVLSFTGGYIADPFLIPPGGGVMTTMRLVHMTTAIVLIASGLLRAIWLLVGNRYARWSAFIPTTGTRRPRCSGRPASTCSSARRSRGSSGTTSSPPRPTSCSGCSSSSRRSPGSRSTGSWAPSRGPRASGRCARSSGPQLIRIVHHLCMWAILAIALFHIYSSVLVDHIERNGLISSIFSGYKIVTPEEIVEARDGGHEVAAQAEADAMADAAAEHH